VVNVRQIDGAVTREVVLRVDFDLLDEDGCSWISMRFRRASDPEPPEPGDVVYLLDDHGSGCVGWVQQVEGWYVCVRPDWRTWTGDSLSPAVAPPKTATAGR
jgi:hypothetical protein